MRNAHRNSACTWLQQHRQKQSTHNKKETKTEHSQQKRKEKKKKNKALTTVRLHIEHIERIQDHSVRLHIEHIELELLNAFTWSTQSQTRIGEKKKKKKKKITKRRERERLTERQTA